MLTNHIRTRAQQRGIKLRHIELIKQYGTAVESGWCMSRKDYDFAVREMKAVLSDLEQAIGIFVANSGDVEKTVFHATRRQQRRYFKQSSFA